MAVTGVLIVGAGPAGLTLACDLARRNVDFRIVDKDPVRPGTRGRGLQPRTLEVFDDLGIVDAILETATPYPEVHTIVDRTVVSTGRMAELRAPTPDVPYPNLMLIPQSRTEEILRSRLAELGGRIEQAELTGFEQDADGVTAVLDATTTVRADYLVGADGGRSHVRKQLGVDFVGTTDETDRMILGNVRAAGLPDRVHWFNWADPETKTVRVGLCPIPGTDEHSVFVPVRVGEDPKPTLQTFQDVLAEVSDVRLSDITWASEYRVNARMAERFRVDRVFLVGDAAHVHTPWGGLGLNTSVQDSYNLGWKLGLTTTHKTGHTVLDSYELERRPIAAAVLGLSDRLHGGGYDIDKIRHSRDATQLTLAYPDSSLSVGGGIAGHRAPDASLRTGRLFDVFRGPHFTLLAFTPASAENARRLSQRFGDVVRSYVDLADSAGQVRRAYGNAELVLVRPDGYIAVYDEDPENCLATLLQRVSVD